MTKEQPVALKLLTASLLSAAVLGLSACATVQPSPMADADLDQVNKADS